MMGFRCLFVPAAPAGTAAMQREVPEAPRAATPAPGGGNSGITVDNTGTITSGSDGIFVDNSTGGGGQGGDADITNGSGTATGGAGGVGGTSGVVTVTNSGTINADSDGIFVENSAGSGGSGAMR